MTPAQKIILDTDLVVILASNGVLVSEPVYSVWDLADHQIFYRRSYIEPYSGRLENRYDVLNTGVRY